MLDSGSSVSLIREEALTGMNMVVKDKPSQNVRVVTAAGEDLPILYHVTARVKLNMVDRVHDFLVVENLVAAAILGVDFLRQQGLLLDFRTAPVTVLPPPNAESRTQSYSMDDGHSNLEKIWARQAKKRDQACSVADITDPDTNIVDECTIPAFGAHTGTEAPAYVRPCFNSVVKEFSDLLSTHPGVTKAATHHINTVGPPARVPPRRIPAHFQEEVEHQIRNMLQKGRIEESSSPWMAPAVYVRKKTGEIRLCVDYRELNKRTHKDAYPLPLIDEVQDRLSGDTVFTKLDLHSGYWQVPVNQEDQEKTAFPPGPGMGLFQFKRMPFGLCGASSTFQRLMNTVMRGLPYVTTYQDDVLIHSPSEETHKKHQHEALQRLRQAGLTLRGSKCQIGIEQVVYLGHVFSAEGMTPDNSKVQAVQEWPRPRDATEVRQFIGLASYYRRYIQHFADIARPLHRLTQKDATYCWSEECEQAFRNLKTKLTEAPILAYPRFDKEASPLVLQTDASLTGLGAVLEQDGQVIAYASRTLSMSEVNYSVIQRECLAVVWGTKQFRHYLLGRPFQLWTDDEPLKWLAGQKMEGILCRWAIALQEYTYTILYRKGTLNGNADALSRRADPKKSPAAATAVQTNMTMEDIRRAQQQDDITKHLMEDLKATNPLSKPHRQQLQPWRRYAQIWSQLSVMDGVVCRRYTPDPTGDVVTVPVLPKCLQHKALVQCHDHPAAGHQGSLLWSGLIVVPYSLRKQVLTLLHEGHPGIWAMRALAWFYVWWPRIDSEIEVFLKVCYSCQENRPRAPETLLYSWNSPSEPWARIHIDYAGPFEGMYWLVVVDSYSKWVEIKRSTSMTAITTIKLLREIFCQLGIPKVIVSDNGPQFVSQEFQEFGNQNYITHIKSTPYHPKTNGLAERMVRTFKERLRAGKNSSADLDLRLQRFLLSYRNTPHKSTGRSPAELLMGHWLRSKLDLLKPDANSSSDKSSVMQKLYHDNKAQPCWFFQDEAVWVQKPSQQGYVAGIIKKRYSDYSYLVDINGIIRRKHADQLRVRHKEQSDEPADEPVIEEHDTVMHYTHLNHSDCSDTHPQRDMVNHPDPPSPVMVPSEENEPELQPVVSLPQQGSVGQEEKSDETVGGSETNVAQDKTGNGDTSVGGLVSPRPRRNRRPPARPNDKYLQDPRAK